VNQRFSFPASSGERKAYWAALAAVVAIHLAVLWIPAYNTLVDFPAHLNRAWALYAYDRTPFFQDIFVRILDPVPNLAIDLVVPVLLNFLPPIAAGKVFLSLIVLLFAAGCHWLAVVIYGRPSWTAPIAVFAVFNSTFLWGFVNSEFSLSLFLVTLPAWLAFRKRWSVLRWLAVTALATATYIAHLSGFVFLGLAMGIFRLLEFRENRRIRIADFAGFSVLLPAMLIQLYPWRNRLLIGKEVVWGGLMEKFIGLGSVFLGFRYDLNVLTMVLLGVAFAVVAAKGKVHLEPRLLWLCVTFLVFYLVCPLELAGASAVDARFVPPAVVFLLLSFDAICPRDIGRLALATALAAMLLRLGEVGWNLNQLSSVAELQIAALVKAAPHTRIYDLMITPRDPHEHKILRANLHVPSYSLILLQSVSSDIFGMRGQQPLTFRHPEEWISDKNPASFDPAYLDARLVTYDYLWGCNLDPPHLGYIERRATLVSTAGLCGLWKLKK
jgi:hypothetical protein